MGWNSYNHYSCSPNESIISSNALALKDLGLADLGYTYVTTDCGWTIPHRTANNTLTWNATLFPSGFPALGEYIHSLGLGFGVYSDGGLQMCMTGGVNQTGSLGHETTDADTFVSWGADLLKYDNCYSSAERGFPNTDYAPLVSPRGHYVAMREAIDATGRDLLFQICDWGVDFPSLWAPALGNTWRVTNDIIPEWKTVYRIVNQVVPQTDFAGPGQWLDLDMLEIGNRIFTNAEEKTHFSLWSILKSPLTIGCALNDTMTSVPEDSLAVLKNEKVIGYNQDSLGVSAGLKRRFTDEGYDVWAGPLSGNRTVVALVNWNNFSIDATLALPDVGLQSAGWVVDAWTNRTTRDVVTSYTAKVEAHGTLLLELGDTTSAGVYNLNGSVYLFLPPTKSEILMVSRRTGNITLDKVYGITTSSNYTMTISFTSAAISTHTLSIQNPQLSHKTSHLIQPGQSTLTIPMFLSAGQNTLSLYTTQEISSLTITPPTGTFYPSTAFSVTGDANHITCTPTLCSPVGAKIGNITPSSSASITIPASLNTTTTAQKYLELHYVNNDIALSTSWTTGRNARNLTVTINNVTTRLEVPLSGRSSELFSAMNGWGDVGVLGVLSEGWRDGDNEVVVGNVDGAKGVQSFGADFVGVRVF